ncbi:MAG: hypothetical protein SFZ23_08710 [Planctomycetota bacterium]|nr:hypothetical protein [Planctomycetota bacterium]
MNEPQLHEAMRGVAAAITLALPPGTGFCLVAASFDGKIAQYHRDLARALGRFRHARIVLRYGAHPLIAELYLTPGVGVAGPWHVHAATTRNMAGHEVQEWLITQNA